MQSLGTNQYSRKVVYQQRGLAKCELPAIRGTNIDPNSRALVKETPTRENFQCIDTAKRLLGAKGLPKATPRMPRCDGPDLPRLACEGPMRAEAWRQGLQSCWAPLQITVYWGRLKDGSENQSESCVGFVEGMYLL